MRYLRQSPTAAIAEIAKAEAATAAEMQTEADKDDGLEAEDHDLAERAQKRIGKKHKEMKQAQALAEKLRAELDDTEQFSKGQYQRAQAAEERSQALQREIEQLRGATPKAESTGQIVNPDANDPAFRNEKGDFDLKKYEEAREKYLLAKFKAEAAAERVQAENAQKVKAFEARLERAREKYPDFKEVVGAADVNRAALYPAVHGRIRLWC